jgi:3-oxoacyl-[acyl-carrier protein] reductase
MEAHPLAGQVALVTGGARGIGREVVLALARDGVHVVVNYRENRPAAEKTAGEVLGGGGRCELLQFDVAVADEVTEAVKKVVDQHKKIDILVNNAGMTLDNLLVRQRPEEWDRVVDVNLKGIFNCTKAVSRLMIRAKYGRIVNMTSVAGQMGNVGQSVYAATKAGIMGFTRSMARELASRGITVNAVSPGFIETEMTQALDEDTRQRYISAIPLGRFGLGAEVAAVVEFLVGPAAGYITGQVVGVNGGLYM